MNTYRIYRKASRVWVSSFGFCFLLLFSTAAQEPTNGDEILFRAIDGTSYVIRIFTSDGDFTAPTFTTGSATVDYLVVGGGGAGGSWTEGERDTNNALGGGGAGGFLEGDTTISSGASLSVTVGAGGQPVDNNANLPGEDGGDSIFGSVTAIGGGGGGGGGRDNSGEDGGSGGGGTNSPGVTPQAGSGEPGQGHDGGVGSDKTGGNRSGGGGGGAGGPGADGSDGTGGIGGDGQSSSITGDLRWYAGGGGGGGYFLQGAGGSDVGGRGGSASFGDPEPESSWHNDGVMVPAMDGLANTGSGGGGAGTGRAWSPWMGGAGGSGIVVARYAFDAVEDATANGYALHGNVRRVWVEDGVNVRVADGDTLSILAGGELRVEAGAELEIEGTLSIGNAAAVGGGGIVHGGLTLSPGAHFVFSATDTLTVTGGDVDLGDLDVSRLVGLDSTVALGEYTLISGDGSFDFSGVGNRGEGDMYDLGDGKFAFFEDQSLTLHVVPEPASVLLLITGVGLLAMRRRRVG